MEIALDVIGLDAVADAFAEKFLIVTVPLLGLFVWLYFSIFCHELGHFVCAKLVGMSPYLMKVGWGFRIFRKRFFGAQIEFRFLPFGGETHASFSTNWSTFKDLKLKLIIYSIGGCLANSVLLACLMA